MYVGTILARRQSLVVDSKPGIDSCFGNDHCSSLEFVVVSGHDLSMLLQVHRLCF